MLNLDKINVYYGAIHAIKDISIEVNEGEIVTLIGANWRNCIGNILGNWH